jgi:hypothetical protein
LFCTTFPVSYKKIEAMKIHITLPILIEAIDFPKCTLLYELLISAGTQSLVDYGKEDCSTGAEIPMHYFSSVLMQTLFIKLRAESSLMSAFNE